MLNLIKKRKNCYEFSDKDVSTKNIKYVLTAGRFAPSSHNSQDWKFVVIKNKQKIAQITSNCCYGLFHSAPPVIIAIIANPLYEKEKPGLLGKKLLHKVAIHKYLNVGFAADHIILAAQHKNIDSSIISPSTKLVDKILKIPARSETVLCVALGYEKKGGFRVKKARKPEEQIIRYETYSSRKK